MQLIDCLDINIGFGSHFYVCHVDELSSLTRFILRLFHQPHDRPVEHPATDRPSRQSECKRPHRFFGRIAQERRIHAAARNHVVDPAFIPNADNDLCARNSKD
jgi:hypothetical protein